MKISIIGTGIYGLSLAINIANNDNQITMWSENKELVDNFKKTHKLKSIANITIPKKITVTNSLEEALKKPDLIILATSAKYIRETCTNMLNYYNNNIPIAIASKGIENDTCCFLSDIVKSILKAKHIAVISGPTFATDLMNLEPSALSVASLSKKAKVLIHIAFYSEHLKIKDNKDIYGTQICGSIKNIVAIAAGILDGLGYKESTRAFLLTESIQDIKDLLKKLDCDPNTVSTYAGIGDLLLTAGSNKSRNYQFGILIGQKSSEKDIENYLNNNTVEGYYSIKSFKELTKTKNIKIPIINIIYNIVIKHKDPEKLIEFLMYKN